MKTKDLTKKNVTKNFNILPSLVIKITFLFHILMVSQLPEP